MSEKIALIDGYGFVFRAYHSLPPLTRKDGTPTNAVYGFTNMLVKLLANLDVSHVAVVFDAGSKTFRNDIFPNYKANRPPCPEDLKPQFPIVREAAESLNLAVLEKAGFEADDIIATLTKKFSRQGKQVLIVSSDKDLMQLVSDNVFMFDAMKNKMIGENEVKEKFFVAPNQVLDVLSLIGDSSDNVAGVRGIGPKTAAELINEYQTLENLFENLDKIRQEKRRQMLIDGKESAILAKKLITLDENVELGINEEDLKIKAIDGKKFIHFLQEQGFNSLVSRVKKDFNLQDAEIANNHENKIEKSASTNFSQVKEILIEDEKLISEIYQKSLENGQIFFDLEENLLTISTAKINENIKEVYYLENENLPRHCQEENKAKQSSNQGDLFNYSEKTEEKITLKNFTKIFENPAIKKIFFDAKKFLKLAKINAFDDLLLINHLVNSDTKNSLYELACVNLDENIEELEFSEIFSDLEKKKQPKAFEDLKKKINFCTFKNFAISQIYKNLQPKIFAQKLNNCYFSYELPLLDVLAQIEKNGITIDVEKLAELSIEFAKKIAILTKEIHDLVGEEFNIASSQQLSEILFSKLNLESSKKSKKTGALSTNAKVLEELAEEGHLIADKILEFRKFSKLKNTYTDALPKEINPETSRIHSTFASTATITGRLSSHNPNLQNIPIKTIDGKKIRQCFIAGKNNFLISADYSQIELRVIAARANIEALKQAFREGKDIHKITAAQVFQISEDEVTEEMRSRAKAINFGIIYGISAFGLARALKISRSEAGNYIKSYLETYPGIDVYMQKTIEFARQNGFVETLSGRKCFINEINNKNPIIRGEAERLAINAPIQGGAADIIKKAMINISKKLQQENLQTKIISQIHDELILEAPENEVEIAKKLLIAAMEGVDLLPIKLKVDVEIAKNWQ
jgi:DNA polymerase-1